MSMVRCPKVNLALVIAAGILAASCASSPTRLPSGIQNPDKYLFDRGTELLNDRKWVSAREFFRQIVDGYPQSTYRADARLGVGDTYLGEGTTEGYVLAINEFKEFLTYYPTHPRSDYAQLKLAMAHYQQMRDPQRDQTETRDALAEFQAFFDRYPNSPLMDEAKQRYREARDRLSESEYSVGLFYFRIKWYPGAIDRLDSLLKEDPEYSGRDAVYFYLAESLLKVKRDAEALPYYERLVKEFTASEFLEEAWKRIDSLKETLHIGKPS